MVRERLDRLLSGAKKDDASVAYRASVAGLVFVSALAAVLEGAVGVTSGVLALGLVPVGFVVSYRRRFRRNLLLKAFLALGLFVAFGAFLAAVRGATSIDDARAPLVGVFLWSQVLHSFDVPRARDLLFSIAAGVGLVALAGSLAFSTGFVVVMLAFAVLFVVSLALGYASELRSRAGARLARESAPPVALRRTVPALARPVAVLLAGTLVVTGVVFVFIPRLPGTRIATLPFSFNTQAVVPGFIGGVANPSRRGQGGRAGESFDPNAYFGYGDDVDLRVRGRLSDDLVLRVRSPRPALYRAQAFDDYAGGKWTSSDVRPGEVSSQGLDSIVVPTPPEQRHRDGTELVQTFYAEQDLPNVLFHAYQATEVYVPSSRVRIDDFSSIRMPFFLEKDSIYSVVSYVPRYTRAELLAAAPASPDDPRVARYLELPSSLEGRFANLARRITGPYPAAVDKAAAVERWLHTHKRYRLDIPPDPPGRDPVDVFVFDRREGFCEQIAATMTLMLRASGVPARLVTGFGPGDRNLFSGYWEVRNSDAHAWVEVLYPGVGWVTYDPTFGVPVSDAANTTFMLLPIQRFASKVFASGPLRAVTAAASRFATGVPIAVVAMGVLAAAWLGVIVARRRVARKRSGERARVERAWMELERTLRRRGLRRRSSETALEFGRRASASLGPDVVRVSESFGRVRYGTDVTEAEIAEWETRARDVARTAKLVRRT